MLYKRGARLFHRASAGPLVPGLQNGYAITAFDKEEELRAAVTHYKYSELIKHCQWKVGTAEWTHIRLKDQFVDRAPPASIEEQWERFYSPLTTRLSKYQGDTKSLAAGQCKWMEEVAIKKYCANGTVAFLMIPLILAFPGTDKQIENEMSEMLVNAGAEVHNNKAKQEGKERKPKTEALMGMKDEEYGIDKLLKLTPTLKKIGFDLHPSYKKSRK